mmetsp:Transcript_17134/g.35815  ORF Transcript_17134/g.35815 Transcript_17134/m.35815 type:complete len:156 (-) Transcript_17134:51-518(-)
MALRHWVSRRTLFLSAPHVFQPVHLYRLYRLSPFQKGSPWFLTLNSALHPILRTNEDPICLLPKRKAHVAPFERGRLQNLSGRNPDGLGLKLQRMQANEEVCQEKTLKSQKVAKLRTPIMLKSLPPRVLLQKVATKTASSKQQEQRMQKNKQMKQ